MKKTVTIVLILIFTLTLLAGHQLWNFYKGIYALSR